MKRLDWASALGITLDRRNVGPANAFELCASSQNESPVWSQRLERPGRMLRGIGLELLQDALNREHRLGGTNLTSRGILNAQH